MRILFLQLLIFLSCTTVSQQLYFNHLSVNNGLSQGVNTCILKDSKGYVWISSFDGLNRFDGIECKKYYADPGSAHGIRGTLFLTILEDWDGNMWIGSNEGLNFYNRGKDSFTCFTIKPADAMEQFCSPFYIDDKNRIWVQSGSSIFIFDPQQKTFFKCNSLEVAGNIIVKAAVNKLYQPLRVLIAVPNNATGIFTGSVTADVIKWNAFPLHITAAKVNTLQFHNEQCWIGTSKGLYHFTTADPANCTSIIPSFNEDISSLHIDKTGTLWAGTSTGGLFKTDTASNILRHFTSDPGNGYSISANHVMYIYTDDNRNLWLSVWGKGVDYTNLGKFHFNQYISKAEAIAAGTDNFIRSVIAVNNEIWCASQSGGVIVLDTAKKIKQVIKGGLPSSVEHLCEDGNRIWAATFSGLYSIDAVSKSVTKISSHDALRSRPGQFQYNYVCRLHSGNLLLSSNAGLYMCRKKDKQPSFILLKGIPASDVYLTTYENENGDLFISKAFGGFGIYRLSGDSLVPVKQFSLQATIKCFSDTKDSLMWIGSTVGLIKFNKISNVISRIFTTNDGLANQYIYGIVAQGEYLWLSSNAGISRFATKYNTVKTFSIADGLQANEYNTYAFCRTKNGEVLFGGVNGLNSFDPGAVQPFSVSPGLVLSTAFVEDSVYPLVTDKNGLAVLQVGYKQNTIGFRFTAIDYVNANAAYISYKLDGYDKSWVTAPNKSFIRYANLPPGDYALQVKAFNADGVESAETYRLAISVMPPWWKTIWFRLLAITFTVSILVLLIRVYLRRKLLRQKLQLEKELAVEQERIRMARELHDGLGSMLSGIKHSFTAIKNESQLDNEEQKKFEYTIDKLDDSIKDLRAISHTMFSAELLEEGLDAAIKNYCNSVSVTARIPVRFESIYRQPAGLKGEQAFHIFRIVQELVQNIVKHSQATEALVQLSFDEGVLALTVEDNGKGFDMHKAKLQDGIGLKNVEGRVKMLHGKMDVQSQPGKGTSVYIEVQV